MNFEVAILNGFSLDSGKYNNEVLKTPSERIFFNWLQKVGGIKFNGNHESLDGYGYEVGTDYITLYNERELETADKTKSYRIANKLYTWKGGAWRSRILVSKTVQYIGTIDMINNVDIDYDSFNEIYLNIPAGAGASTDVYFDNAAFDENYKKGTNIYVERDEYCKNVDYIIGREQDITNPTLAAIYDSDIEYGYKIDSGYCINFNDSRYHDDKGKVGIDAMNFGSNEDFEFNCVLIYYIIRKGDGAWQTNLYGVLFLEDATTSDYNTNLNIDDEIVGYIQRYPKFKDGNSWGLKIDLKVDAQPDSQLVMRDIEYDDPNAGGSGMQMFSEALVHLNDCTKLFYEVKSENTAIEERIYKLENIVSDVDSVYNLREDIDSIKSRASYNYSSIESLKYKLEDMESRLLKLETNLGLLINSITVKNKN
jgi:hypothetical protein